MAAEVSRVATPRQVSIDAAEAGKVRLTGTLEAVAMAGAATLYLGPPATRDGASIHALVRDCTPLDLNSVYAYLLLCEHHAATCVRASMEGQTVGFVSAYRPPQRPDVIFVWQVAVSPDLRGTGLARRMLAHLLRRDAVRDCTYLETTVSPSNIPSRRLFEALARERAATLEESVLFSESAFGPASHEVEVLFRIGPLHPKATGGT